MSMEDDDLTERLSLAISKALIRSIDNWRRAQPEIPSRASAARTLMTDMLKAHGYGPGAPAKAAALAKAGAHAKASAKRKGSAKE